LASGALRRVEDIRTEDFIQSALRSQLFELREATVVRIDRAGSPSHVTLTFSYDTQHAKVNLSQSPSLYIPHSYPWLFSDGPGGAAGSSYVCLRPGLGLVQSPVVAAAVRAQVSAAAGGRYLFVAGAARATGGTTSSSASTTAMSYSGSGIASFHVFSPTRGLLCAAVQESVPGVRPDGQFCGRLHPAHDAETK